MAFSGTRRIASIGTLVKLTLENAGDLQEEKGLGCLTSAPLDQLSGCRNPAFSAKT
jgi:hypothetical protein